MYNQSDITGFKQGAQCALCAFSTQDVDACHLPVPMATPWKGCHFQTRVIWYVRFKKEEIMMTTTIDECASVRESNASPWALCVCVSVPWANKLYEGKLGSTCPYCHALTHTHSHTFPLSTQHPILSKDEERAKPCMRQRPPIQIKTVNPMSFLSLSLDMFLKATEVHCASVPLLSCV